jgi:hypothetical protein
MAITLTLFEAGLDQVLDGGLPDTVYLSAHSADPGTTGANELTGGRYSRGTAVMGAASSGSRVSSGTPYIPANGGDSATHVCMWTAETGGVCLAGGQINGDGSPETSVNDFRLNVPVTVAAANPV